ncbi:MAG: hypothetical protein ABL867_04320 [Rickettsiales bacterium]
MNKLYTIAMILAFAAPVSIASANEDVAAAVDAAISSSSSDAAEMANTEPAAGGGATKAVDESVSKHKHHAHKHKKHVKKHMKKAKDAATEAETGKVPAVEAQ